MGVSATSTVLAAAFTHTSNGEAVAFWILGPIALAAALLMVISKSAVHSALWLILTMFCLAAFYFIQEAPFLGVVQIIVYTGAIMVLFLFVLMLVGVDSSESLVETLRGQRVAAIVLGIGFAGLLVFPLASAVSHTTAQGLSGPNAEGNVQGIARILFTNYVWAFEVVSALLIIAAVGAMVLAHRERGERPTQREMSIARIRGAHPSPLPGPGIVAHHDSVDTPALLPDGSIAELSLSRTPQTDEDQSSSASAAGETSPELPQNVGGR
jgi:NADH-quinone oxidoreductase subunit J